MKCFVLGLPDDTVRYVEGAKLPRIGEGVELEKPIGIDQTGASGRFTVVKIIHTYGWKVGADADIYEETDRVRVLLSR